MAQREEFEVTIGPDGEIRIEVTGVQGKSCLELTEFLEKALGNVKARNLKPEYYQEARAQEQKLRGKN